MRYTIAILGVFIGIATNAQKNLNVLDWKAETTLHNYLVQQMHAQYDQRRKKFSDALRSATDMRAYIQTCRRSYLAILGDLPPRTTLNPVVTGTLDQNDYQIQKLLYESFPGHHVTANLYVPKGNGPFPAVLLFCGHEDVAKATESYQQTAILFARNGYVVLVIDPVSQAERYQLIENGKPLTRGGTTEHTLLNEASNLLGESTPKDELLDNVRGLDYLVTRPEVDTARIGCLGNSGGGMQTIYFAGFDRRIKVMAPCSYVATRERTLELTGPADGCAQMPGEGKQELEFADFLLMAAPKPLLILAGRYDFIDYRGAEEAYGELKKAYTVLGKPEQVELFTYDDGHGISKPKREAAVAWFNRWLKHDSRPIHEAPAKLLTAAELQVTVSGQVQSSPPEKNIPYRNLSLYAGFAANRASFTVTAASAIRKEIATLAGINYNDRQVTVEDKGTAELNGLSFVKRIIRKHNEPPLPALVLFPDTQARQVTIWCSDSGKIRSAAQTDALRSLQANGNIVVLCDLRGTGETEDKAEFNDPKYFNREYRNAMLALHIGRPLVGQRATDILSVVDMLHADNKTSALPVSVRASGAAALPALHAALFSETELSLSGTIRSWKEVLDKPTTRDWYSIVVPGALKYYDLPDLQNLLHRPVSYPD
ncbi:MAG: acetylxylan esterase [Chitinophagaceae bacterium]|nr:acetylxylan esterase [Chitinophagaceae bacterium]